MNAIYSIQFDSNLEMWEREFEGIHCFQESSFAFISKVFKRGFLRDEVRVPNDGTNEETIIGHFLTLGQLLKFSHHEFHIRSKVMIKRVEV